MECHFEGLLRKVCVWLEVPSLDVFYRDPLQHRRTRDRGYIDGQAFHCLSESHYNVTLNISGSRNRRVFNARQSIRRKSLSMTNT
jgi:hypothetical protein